MSSLAESATRAWVATYTRRMSADVQDGRSAEIESDLWEHRSDAAERGLSPRWSSVEMTNRMMAGIPADLAWRRARLREQRRTRRAAPTERITMSEVTSTGSRYPNWVYILGFLMGGSAVLFGVTGFLFGDDSQAWGFMIALTGVVILGGLIAGTRFPLPSTFLLVVGGLAFGFLTFWMVLTIVAGFALAAGAVFSWPRVERSRAAGL